MEKWGRLPRPAKIVAVVDGVQDRMMTGQMLVYQCIDASTHRPLVQGIGALD